MFIVDKNGIARKVSNRRKRKLEDPYEPKSYGMKSAECVKSVFSYKYYEDSLNDYIRDYNELPPIRIKRYA
jgi:hypothetical protein